MANMLEKELDEYTNSLVDAYSRLKKRIRPDYAGRVRDFTKWRAAGEKLLKLKLNPYAYIQFVFDIMLRNHPDVYVDMVLSHKMIDSFLEKQPELNEKARLMFRLQAEDLKGKVSNGYTLREVLLDEYNGYQSVFRFATAWSEGLTDIAEKYRNSAERALLFEPIWRELLKPWLPKELQ